MEEKTSFPERQGRTSRMLALLLFFDPSSIQIRSTMSALEDCTHIRTRHPHSAVERGMPSV